MNGVETNRTFRLKLRENEDGTEEDDNKEKNEEEDEVEDDINFEVIKKRMEIEVILCFRVNIKIGFVDKIFWKKNAPLFSLQLS